MLDECIQEFSKRMRLLMKLLKELYAYREMIFSLVRRDLTGRYKGSILGFFWTFLNPLLQLFVYTFVFSTVMKNGIPDYYLFLFVALVPWIFFSTCVSGGTKCIWTQKDMVKKIYFPREVLPISYVTSQFVNMLLSFLVIFFVLFVSGKSVNFIALLYLPGIMLIEYLLALGMTMLFSALTVYIRDLEHISTIVVMLWQFLSPVMYSVDRIPENIRSVFYLNPMTPIIVAYRDILYYGIVPTVTTLVHAMLIGIILVVFGTLVFGRLKKHFVEEM